MVNYANGKIYTIRCRSDENLIYVGSTSQTLSQRMTQHRSNCKRGKGCSLYDCIIDNDWDDWYIELYEYYFCNNKTELEKREGEVIREIGTLNKCIAGRTIKEWCKDNADKIKDYYKDNADKIKERVKNYQKNNADIIKEKNKKYRENNTEYFKERNKKYREDNYEKLKEKSKEKVCCNICGAFSLKNHLVRHQKTKKCTDIASKSKN